jgi:5'-deoxynucleotidase YfbR-like HD superfamily hydrolase
MDHYEAWRSGKVVRMHTAPQLHRENIAEHTWGVLLAVIRYYPQASALFLKQVIVHDAGEKATGDMPGNVKWANPIMGETVEAMEKDHVNKIVALPALSRREGMLLEIFDRLDFCISCLHEMRLGNVNSALYFGRSYDKAVSIILSYQPTDDQDAEFRKIATRFLDEVTMLRQTYLSHIPEHEFHER